MVTESDCAVVMLLDAGVTVIVGVVGFEPVPPPEPPLPHAAIEMAIANSRRTKMSATNRFIQKPLLTLSLEYMKPAPVQIALPNLPGQCSQFRSLALGPLPPSHCRRGAMLLLFACPAARYCYEHDVVAVHRNRILNRALRTAPHHLVGLRKIAG